MIKNTINTQMQTQTMMGTPDTLTADFKQSVVIVSLLVNLALIVTWLTTIA